MTQRVLVTGGAGYIGSVLCGMLQEAGHDVHILDRFFFGKDTVAHLDSKRTTIITDDIRYVTSDIFEGIDVVIDLAGISNDPACDLDPEITNDINRSGMSNVAELAKAAGVSRFIYSSSCSIYGAGGATQLTETSKQSPVSLYAKTKIEAEKQLLELHDDAFTVSLLRNATVYGLSPRMRFDLVINIMTLLAYKDRRIHVLGGGKQWRPLVHVQDVARAFITVMDAPKEKIAGEAFNVGSNDQNYQVFRIARMIRDVIPYTDVVEVPDDPDKRSYNVNFSKIQDVLEFQVQRTPFEGIVEIKQALERGDVEDTIRTKTVHYYRYLLEAEKVLNEVSYNGKVF